MAKNLKSPNRYGGVTKLSNASRRRRPYAVRITTGYVMNEKTGKSTQKYAIEYSTHSEPHRPALRATHSIT